MPVNLPEIIPASLNPIEGIRLGWAESNIKKPNRKDLLIIEIADGSAVSGVFTQNRFCAAPVTLCKKHLNAVKNQAVPSIKALVINTGNANAGTGEQGMNDAIATCEQLAEIMAIPVQSILPFSTGVILEHLPMDKLLAGLPHAVANLTANNWADAASTIMTTDVAPKAYATQVNVKNEVVNITGISKGAGMIHPNMATMLGYVATDANITQTLLDEITKEIADLSFNCISVDGDTSTNDSFIVIATGKSNTPEISDRNSNGFKAVFKALLETAQYLAQAIVRDGEGATKFLTVTVKGALTNDEAKTIGFSIGKSPLVKTAMFASDPNLGRVLAAIGYASRECASLEDLDTADLELYFGDVLVAEKGGRADSYNEDDGQAIMNEAEIDITVQLHRGNEQATIWTCDFSYDYVRINAEYRT
ncbi:bifunctional glutamate N-acetyltransferase/amino-acid acetyltransferase ArgJ [Colwellia sp. 1_MG-2023]|uniref:bifunctional glutamate N-acetyltransferase/amino-acid acetyltransferase ArgJ n=1 Tax=unclassified Colwellia TaxID=196834 RepID=UPI001C088B15|nr:MULTISPECIES: bifunctional glutamate N-acetyltransferase/amino-acid acetyltransferase ArgJ [unclassified Colwellia]MBU2925509.1 bifunctional glutamate N-acetyltransferase/amino-acid acetyltransferase ArgJ [Colwellia sp. C2M11]MDO6651523.1 bifunctional glutamate N-acetyltransferase/amino-acid acetyltransferase ArgJ [Colwellia sp. 3_MG-2023]MDO6665079.1 bifunctional glutamate N-acetyltransferase/amino-acid acetyltransferase ArgJ [Colwellia sp. 2_MG-2023]MDO6689452.1 bifunctional glutamate N-ac